MTASEPVLNVLLYGSLAAALAGLGAVPYAFGRRLGPAWVGSAYALASGLMLGLGYLLMSRGLDLSAVAVVVGAVVGVAYTYLIQLYAGLDRLERPTAGRGGNGKRETDGGDLQGASGGQNVVTTATGATSLAPEVGYKVILQDTLHSAAEGVAIGVAMVLDLRLGIFVALALAVHNVGEAMALTDVLRRHGVPVTEALGLCVVTKVPQPLLALAAFALSPVIASFLPGALGFAAGSLVFLVLTELIPESYERTRHEVVALLVSLAAAAVVLLEDFFV